MSEIPSQVRTLYAIILTTCVPTNPLALWGSHRDSMTEDYLHHHRLTLSESNLSFTDDMYNQSTNQECMTLDQRTVFNQFMAAVDTSASKQLTDTVDTFLITCTL